MAAALAGWVGGCHPGAPAIVLNAPAFVHVEKVGGMMGGGTARTEAIHVGGDGRVQVSTEETDGTLHRLREGVADVSRFFRDRARAGALPPGAREDRGLATEFHPPARVVAESIPGRGYAWRSWPEGEVPGGGRALIADVEAIAAATPLAAPERGLYVRAYRMPHEAGVRPDVVLDAERAHSDPELMRVMEAEMALVRIAGARDAAQFAAFRLLPERPMHVQFANRLYVLFAYRFDPR